MDYVALEDKMRRYEDMFTQYIQPNCFFVARLDGRNFHTLAKREQFAKPMDIEFLQAMSETCKYMLAKTDFNILYAYTQSDEISLLFGPKDDMFNRKSRKFLSLLAAEASVAISNYFEFKAIFDCRIIPLSTIEDVLNYFSWRQEDSYKNCINSYCGYLVKTNENLYGSQIYDRLLLLDINARLQLMAQYGVELKSIPVHYYRGTGFYKSGRLVIVDTNLPFNDEYREIVKKYALKGVSSNES